MKKRNGFTLVELLIVMTIVVVLAVMMIGIFNSAGVINKGRDAERKKDLKRIKEAFEEYFNDRGTYPLNVGTWNIKSNCDSSTIFTPYLVPWPCDQNGNPYIILTESNNFRIITNLQNKKDSDILQDWYTRTDIELPDGLTKEMVNYGVSSSNILWYDKLPRDYSMCDTSQCNAFDGANCEDRTFCDGNSGNCYYSDGGACTERCKLEAGMTCTNN